MDSEKKEQIGYPVRINRYLALRGISSRREADRLIASGKVLLNGKRAQLGDRVNSGDEVRIIGKTEKKNVYLAYNKPRGIVTHSPQGKGKGIADVFRYNPPVFPVGRLDKDSWGLILLTNDGRITGKILEPELQHEKEYEVKVDRPASERFLRALSDGVVLDDGYRTRKCSVEKRGEDYFRIILTEGKKHQIRRMCQQLGYQVLDLKRVRVMNIRLGLLAPGEFRKLKGRELDDLLAAVGLSESLKESGRNMV